MYLIKGDYIIKICWEWLHEINFYINMWGVILNHDRVGLIDDKREDKIIEDFHA